MDIICSIGPRVRNIFAINEFINAGMTIARFNFSHVDYDKFNKLISYLKKNKPDIKVMQDLQGNKIRISSKYKEERKIYRGSKIIFCVESIYEEMLLKHKEIVIPISYAGTFTDFKNVTKIFMKDGTMGFKVIKHINNGLIAITERGGILRAEKGINAPNLDRRFLKLTKKDEEDILWAVKRDIDIICLSFVTSEKDIIELKKYINKVKDKLNIKKDIKVWAKIECNEGIENIQKILENSDGIMLGRGDLRGECEDFKIPIIEEKVIEIMKNSNKFFSIGTYILSSMQRNPSPSIAELNDIYKYVKNHVDALMLSTEITNSKNPNYLIKYLKTLIKNYSSDY